MPVGGGHTASVVAVADGTASLYTTSGFGIIGAGAHPKVRVAADSFLDAVESAYSELSELNPPRRVDFPPPGSLAIVALTYGGIRRGELDRVSVDAKSALGLACLAGSDLLTEMRVVHDARQTR